jgi:hypothetical protein
MKSNLIGHSMTVPPPVLSPATFVSLRFHSLKEKFGSHLKNVIVSIFHPF